MRLIKNKKKLQNQISSLQKENELLRVIVCNIIDGNTKLLKSICSKLDSDATEHQDQTEAELMKQILKPILIKVLIDYDIERGMVIRKHNTIYETVEEKEVIITFKYKHSVNTLKDFNIYISEEAFGELKDLFFEINGGLIV